MIISDVHPALCSVNAYLPRGNFSTLTKSAFIAIVTFFQLVGRTKTILCATKKRKLSGSRNLREIAEVKERHELFSIFISS